jgi:hypothetical protein
MAIGGEGFIDAKPTWGLNAKMVQRRASIDIARRRQIMSALGSKTRATALGN